MNTDFGIYIQTYPGDYYLSRALIQSIRHWHPDVPIRLIPDTSVDVNDHPFDVPFIEAPSPYLATLEHTDRSFWSFYGPFDKFIFLDGDQCCVRPISRFIERILAAESHTVFGHTFYRQEEWTAAIHAPSHPRYREFHDWVRNGLGIPKHMAAMDPDWDFLARPSFPSGVFAGTRGAIPEAKLRECHDRERRYYEEVLRRPFRWDKGLVLYMDQGRLNYVVDKLGLPLENVAPDGQDNWVGKAFSFSLRDCFRGDAEFAFLHWGSVPRPSPGFFNQGRMFRWYARQWMDGQIERDYPSLPEIPGYEVWRHFYEKSGGPMDWATRLGFLRRELRVARRLRRKRRKT